MDIVYSAVVNFEKRETHGSDEQLEAVQAILKEVKESGDVALRSLTEKFDGIDLENFKVSEEEVKAAYESLEKRRASLKTLQRIASALGVKLKDLF